MKRKRVQPCFVGRAAAVAGALGLCVVTAAAILVPGARADADGAKRPAAPTTEARPERIQLTIESAGTDSRLLELPVTHVRPRRLHTIIEPVDLPQRDGEGGAAAGPGCPDVAVTHTPQSFEGGNYTVQGGFAEQEVAAASYTVAPSAFPLILRKTEMLFGTSQTTVTTTTKWSLMIWEGTPTNGNLIEVFSSDDVILPHLVIPPGTHGVNVQVIVDPSDPDQVVIQNFNNSNTFTIGYRIDEHNNQTQNPCFFAPPSNSNAFPMTSTQGLQQPTQNWLFGVNCGPFGCPANGGWATFQQLPGGPGQLCTPSGDWMIRATYTPFDCPPVSGACCLPDGSCIDTLNTTCAQQGGVFQGENSSCGNIECPLPTGGCCFSGPIGSCNLMTENDCIGAGGTWLGPNTGCLPGACDAPIGACCIPSTGNCVNFIEEDCNLVGGLWQGADTTCAETVCFPIGACCLPDGSCEDELSPDDCDALSGAFQGDGTSCGGVNCPLPQGACCLPNGNCVFVNDPTCVAVGGEWAGMGTNCADTNGSGQADACEAKAPPCPADLNDSGAVDVQDLLILLGAWGPNPGHPADLNDSGAVDVQDLLILLGAWGPCP